MNSRLSFLLPGMELHCIKYITTDRDSAFVSFPCLDSIGTLRVKALSIPEFQKVYHKGSPLIKPST